MHIPDGFLSLPVSLSTLTLTGVYGYMAHLKAKNIFAKQEELIPFVGCSAGLIFATQMLNFPILYGTSGHFLGSTFATYLFGPWVTFFIMSIVLFIQAVFFGDGGILALGSNIFCMGIVAPWMSFFIMKLPFWRESTSGKGLFLASLLAIVAASACCSLLIAFSGTIPLQHMLPAMLSVHFLIGLGEGVITSTALLFLQKFSIIKREECFYGQK